jgi:pimeloyl-ACP methyl ester carboxylesterase
MQHEDEIAGLILHYPAFGMHDIMNDGRSIEDIPEAFDLGGLYVGRIFIEDLWRYDVRDDLPDFDKPVLMIQGSEDDLVHPEGSEAASKRYPDCEYRLIQGAGHGFDGKYHDEASRYALDFLYRQFGIDHTQEHQTVRWIFLTASFALSVAAVIICALIARKKATK